MSHRNRAELEGVETSPDGRYIRFDEKLGSGAYKSVWLAYDTDLGIEVAWNTVDLKRLPEKEKNRLKSETDILKNLNHNCIINFYNSWENAELEQVIFTTEIVTSGTLKQYVSRFKPIKLKVLKKWCRQILQGLCYLHSKNPPIIHRDLKCDNIFINGSTGDIRIGDLGLSTMRNATHAASVLGTPEFMAPELYDEWYTEKVDVYAFGMVVLEMISNEYPYAECTNTAQIFKKVSQGIRPESLNRLQSPGTREFIELCLAKSNVRLAAEELAKHPFLDPRFVDYRERFPIPYDPIVTTTNSSTPLVPVMELAAVAEHSQHSLEQRTISEEEGEQAPESNEVNFLEVILENTSENIARVVLTLDLGTRRKEVKFPFDLGSDTAEAVAIEMVKELGLQQSSVNKLSDGIFAAIKDEKIKWNQTKILLAQNRAVLDNYTATGQTSTSPALNTNLVPAAIPVTNTAHHSVPMLGPTVPPAFPTQLAPSLKPQQALSAVNTSNPSLAASAGIVSGLANVHSNVATDAPMIDPFTGTPLQPSASNHPESFQVPEQASYAVQAQQQPFSPAPTAGYASNIQFQGQPPHVPNAAFSSNTSTPTYVSHSTSANSSFPTPIASTLPKAPASQPHKTPSMPALDSLLVSVSSMPNIQAAGNGVAPPSSFATTSYPQGPSPLISAGSFSQTASIPFVAQPPSSFQSATSTASVGGTSSFGNVSYQTASSFSAPISSLFPNAAPGGTVQPPNMQLTPPQQLPASAAVSQASVASSLTQAGISVPTSQASLTLPSSQAFSTVPSSHASMTAPSSSSPLSQTSSVASSQVLPPSTTLVMTRSDSICELGRFDPFLSGSPTGTTQPPILPSPPAVQRFVKRRSIEDVQFPEPNPAASEAPASNTSTNADNAAGSANPKPAKITPDQALDISNFLSGFDVSQLSPNQLTALRDLRSQLDDSIRILKTQYAAMYREAVNKYKVEVVDNLTGWGFPIPPINLKVQGLGSARGVQQGAPKSVNHLSRRTRDVISLAHGSSNDLISLESNPAGSNNPGQTPNSSLPAIPSQAMDNSNPDHIYNRLIQPFAPAESNADSINSNEVKTGSNILGLVPGPGPNWPPKIDTLDPSIWDPSSQSPSS